MPSLSYLLYIYTFCKTFINDLKDVFLMLQFTTTNYLLFISSYPLLFSNNTKQVLWQHCATQISKFLASSNEINLLNQEL